MNPPTFSGGADPIVAKNWILEIEKTLTVLYYIDDQGVLYATYKLMGDVERWWTTVRLLEEQRPVPIAMTWSRFKKVVFDRYFPATVRIAKVDEFLNLMQGHLIVQQYVANFIELSCFAPYIVPNEAKKERKFERSLRQEIYKQVAVLKEEDFSKLADGATVVEVSRQRGTGIQS
ncbi:uncharacterized protein LOC131160887 [Malania oleifera]|uniref:uncharacterized protein LOC131160887 n=1 Tax=Malania oleifera TaxID=397392 RepID=UPI0025ADD46E|nr:uncharacterized protein LOC131160887 [Malania oleifera]